MNSKLNTYFRLLSVLTLSLAMAIPDAQAQQQNDVVYTDYSHVQADILQLFHQVGGVSSFTSMSVLKREVKKIKESTVVPVVLQKGSKKKVAPAELIRQRKESIMMIWKYIPATATAEKVATFATGIVLSADGICATNYHVLRNMIDDEYKLYPTDSVMFVSIGSGKLYPIKSILTYNKAGDMALFKLDTGKDKLAPFPIGEDLEAGATAHTLTHPEDYMFFYSKGVVSRTICTDAADPFTNRTEISSDYAKGSSGGPIFDDYGNLVAMVSTTRSIYYIERPQTNLQMVVKQTIPVSSILRLIKQ